MNSAVSTPRSSRRMSKIDVLEDSSINDKVWTCSVAMIIEKHPDYKKYIKSFEEGFKNGNRPVIKLINVRDLESSTSRATNKPNLNKGVGKQTALEQSEKNSKGEQIRQKIIKFKTEDMYKLTNRNIVIEKCEALKGDIDLDLIHDEPLCGPSLYIILTGFYDPDLVFELIKLQIPLDVILALEEIESQHKDPSNSLKVEQTKDEHSTKKPKLDPHESFWLGYEERLKIKSNLEITSNLLVFRCNPKEILQGKENLKAKEINFLTYEYVCEQLYRVQNEKRKYVDFMRNIKTTNLDRINRLSVGELKQYCNSVRSVPIEAITVDYILNCIVLQIENDEQVAKTKILNEVGITLNKSSKISLKPELDSRKSSRSSDTAEVESNVKGRKSSDTAEVESDVKGRKSSRSSDTVEGSSKSSMNDEESEANYPTDQMVISSKTKLHIPRTNMTPFVIEYKNPREFTMKGYQDYFEKSRDFHCKVLEGSICPHLWKLFPEIEGKERLYAKSHLQKVKHYFNIRENIILEASLHKRMFNKIILSSVDCRNIDAICHDVFDGYCGCGFDGSLSSTEEEEDHFRRNNRERANTHSTEKTFNTVDTNKTILSFNNNYFPLTRETLDFHAEEEEDNETKERVRKLNELILKNDKNLMDLKHFLNCPDLDNLFSKCYNAIEDYNILELHSKETCLNLLNHYCSTYEFIDYVYYSPTDCIIFVFHRNINENGIVNTSCEGYLLTPVGFRDYYNILLKHNPYLRWIQSRDKIIEKDNYDLMEKFKVFLNEEEAGKCCFQKIHKYGIFPLNENMKSVYQSHAPIPPARTSEDETFTFIGYDMGTACHVHCREDSKSFVSKLGLKIIVKSCDYFDPLKIFNQVSFLNPTCSIFFEIPQATEETTEPIQKAIIETEDGFRIVFTHKRKVMENAVESRKSTVKSSRKNQPVHSGDKVQSIDLEEVHHHEEALNEDDTVIVLPNGLELSIFKINGEVWGLKQRHLEKSSRTPENTEKYRIYLKDGTVLVFMEGGTIKVYYSNTTIAEIARVSSEKEFDDICGNETSDSNKQKANETNNIFPEKRQKGSYYVIGEHKVLTWSGIVKSFKFDFCSKCVAEYDLRTAFEPGTDLFTLRTDGTKSLLNSDGELVVQYPDGTRISSSPRCQILSEIQSDSQEFTLFEEKIQDEEWVMIDLDIHMEQPNNYVPVGYVGGIWIVSLPGDKKLSFRNSKSALLSMVESELSLDHEKHQINFGMFQSDTFAFSNFTVYFSPEEDNAICKLVDDEDCLIIDTEGKMTLKESNFFEDERGIETLIDNYPRFSSGLTMIGPPPVEGKVKASVPDVVSEDESLYAIKPSESQQEFKMVYLRRDLTGCELIKDSEQRLLEISESCPGHKIYDKTEYRNRSCKITLWNILPEGQIYPADSRTKLAYLNPQCFSKTNLKRKNLTKLLPKTRVWLFDTTDCISINKPLSSLCDLRKTSIPSLHPKKTNRAVTMSRKHIDLNEFDGFDSMLDKALNLYLKYKKDIYSAILKNTIDEIKYKQEDPQEKISDRPKTSFFKNM